MEPFSEKIFTIQDIAQHLRVPEEAVLQEVNDGRLPALRLAGHIRIRESQLNAYLTAASIEPLSSTGSVVEKGQRSDKFSPASDFSHTWPDGSTEQFTDVLEGTVPDNGRERRVKIGFTVRFSAGKSRRRSLVLVDRYPTVEFVAAGEKAEGKMASIIKGRDGKQLPIGATLPLEYLHLPIGPYNDVVQGPRASNGLAVICDSEDTDVMVKHALIRYAFRDQRTNA